MGIPFFGKSGTKGQNCHFKLKFGVIQMVRLIFYIFDQNIYIYFLKGRRCRGGGWGGAGWEGVVVQIFRGGSGGAGGANWCKTGIVC